MPPVNTDSALVPSCGATIIPSQALAFRIPARKPMLPEPDAGGFDICPVFCSFGSFMHYKHVIWDWNGTLMNDLELSLDILNALLHTHGKEQVSSESYREHFCFPTRNYYKRFGLDGDIEFDAAAKYYMDIYDRRRFECNLHQGAHHFLTKLRSTLKSQHILSAYKQDTLEEIVSHYGLSPLFDRLSGLSDIYGDSKVSRGKELIADHPELASDTTVMIGDTLHDYEVAEALGIDCILLAHGHQSAERLHATGKPVFHNFLELEASGVLY